ncbi:hypothetical protein [Bradyrhizobium sp. AUGA SZCCT0431]|uniref:hypothetical protein n=1 Tax=Bradyrhizobium sp. AUGA SZCCT0431 TaxID=2807674 RepID=UPI001BA692BF|nr:hypothetical protein [Bradyrhizobium sp. AUGA SZCCT0431]MBR1147503.1 hypothetical protein [Bradyrhizobium sp. AUGA SZCCT0431]
MTNLSQVAKNPLYGIVLVAATSLFTTSAMAQCAGCGADFNRAERSRIQEQQRLERVDPPIRPDPIGNALIGGAVTGTIRGATAGAVSTLRSGAVGTAVQSAKDGIERNKAQNQQTGRGGSTDPRYDPRALFNR